ncbi:unnamed protein product [Cladocopium goreaui]|uniref:Protein HGH1 homolog n=1 Tax=Cladocopium goreaui TaxID=2562237 RepID=A0A9P1BWJ1_9DINO|nr:unnamed protein product [Cladocopium goreaui]
MGRDKQPQDFEEHQIARPIARAKWLLDPDATTSEPKDIHSILANLASASSDELLQLHTLNGALRDGGHDAAEDACRLGGIRISIDMLKSKRPEVLEKSLEALWLLVDDHDSCQELIQRNGHHEIWRILRRHRNDQLASNVFRLMAETLYGESRSSTFWKDGLDGHFLSEALDWSIQVALSSHSSHTLGFVCDVAALWLQRCPTGLEAVKALLHNVPALLQAMAVCPNNALLQHGCRLLWAMAEVTSRAQHVHARCWPESLGQPTLRALEEMKHMDLPPQVMHYHAMALLMVKRMMVGTEDSEAKSSASLDSMD